MSNTWEDKGNKRMRDLGRVTGIDWPPRQKKVRYISHRYDNIVVVV